MVSLTEPGIYNRETKSEWGNATSTLPAGTRLMSWLIHSDQEGQKIKECKVKFGTEILGFQGLPIQASKDAMERSDTVFSPGTTFCRVSRGPENRGCRREIEINDRDVVILSADRKMVEITSRNGKAYIDELRVFMKPKEPPQRTRQSSALLQPACPRNCAPAACPVDCLVDIWQAWGACSVSCGTGTRQRVRWLLDPGHGAAACPPLSEDEPCELDDPACITRPPSLCPASAASAQPAVSPIATLAASLVCAPTLRPSLASLHPSLAPSRLPSLTPTFLPLLGATSPLELKRRLLSVHSPPAPLPSLDLDSAPSALRSRIAAVRLLHATAQAPLRARHSDTSSPSADRGPTDQLLQLMRP